MALPMTGDRVAELKSQLGLLVMAGEMEGWLTTTPQWHVVTDPANAGEWEQLLRAALEEPVKIISPPSPTDLAARTARRAAVASTSLLPVEFTERYKQQFHDRLWLHGLGYAGVLYALFLVVYFCATGYLGYRTGQVESQVAQISNDFTNAIQLKARYTVLKEREQLKYAALDCWQAVAQALPANLSVQRFSFLDGKAVTLSGICTPDQLSLITDEFYDGVRKTLGTDGQPLFDPTGGEQPVFRSTLTSANWNFGLQLMHSEGADQ
jgi:hypothetical protein